jgi:hypothetical protein
MILHSSLLRIRKIDSAFLLRRYSEQDNSKGRTMTVLKREEKMQKGKGAGQDRTPELAAAVLKQRTLGAVGATRKLNCRMMNDR